MNRCLLSIYPKIIALLIIALSISINDFGEDAKWSLSDCIAYAKTNNLSIQQNALTERVAKMQLEQSRYAQLPSVSISSSYGRNFGRSIDPTTNTFISTTYSFTGINGSSSVLLFGWFQTRNTIAQNDFLHKASQADLDQSQNDVALNITTGYLRILLAKEQIKISLKQLEISGHQLIRTQSLLAAGRSNGQDVAQVTTQLSNDSIIYFKATLELNQSIIDLKAILNLDLNTPFDIESFDSQNIPTDLLLLNPEYIYNEAVSKFGTIRSADLKTNSAEKEIAIMKGRLYPQLNLSFSSGTNFSSTSEALLANGEYGVIPWGKQLGNNFSQSVYVNLNIPVFNGLASKYAVKRAKIDLQNNTLIGKEARVKLKQDIYKAFNDMQTSYQTFKTSESAASTASVAQEFAQKRYDKGLITAIDLLIAQNTSFKAKVDAASNQYDYVFKKMVMDYYMKIGVFSE